MELWRDHISSAIVEYEEALNLRKLTENWESRELSESFFLLGNALLYDNKDECESKAIHQYLSAAQILENILSK